MEKNYILWSPSSDKPSTKRFTEKQALVVAEKLSKKNPHEPFYACKIISQTKTATLDSHVWTKTKKA